jgi:ABC-type Zn uptake system ZnuABC Zn-binding protein ZnuA
MQQKRSILLVLVLIIPIALSGLTATSEADVSPSFSVAVSIAPLSGMVRAVGGPYVETSILLEEGVEPHAFTVTPDIISTAEAADLLVFTGHFEWEEDLANETETPFITMHDGSALESYEEFGAEFSPFPGGNHEEGEEHEHDHEGNPHAWWLLPSNAVAIANATRAALSTLNSSLSPVWTASFEGFASEVDALQDLIDEADDEYGFSEMKSVVVFPAEAYVAEAFGIEVEAVLINEGQTISGGELVQVQNAIRNGSISLILGSDVARVQSAGEFAYQLIEDYGGTLVWWRAVFFSGLSDYTGIMTYNLGALTSAMEERVGGGSGGLLNLGLVGLSAILGVIAVAEAVVLYRRFSQ